MNDINIKGFVLICLLAFAVVTGAVYVGTLHVKVQSGSLGDVTTPAQFRSATNGAVGMAGSATSTLIAANSSRVYADICNDNGATTKFYLAFGGTAATSTGILLTGGNCYEVRDVNDFVGNIIGFNASSSAATATLITIP